MGGTELCTRLKCHTEELCKNVYDSVLKKESNSCPLSTRRAFEDNYIHYNSAGTVSGSWAAPQHYRHFFPPDRATDSQRLFMSLWPLCWQGGGLGEAAPELQCRLCSVGLSGGGLTPSASTCLSCNLLYCEEEVQAPALCYGRRTATNMPLIHNTSQIINGSHTVHSKGSLWESDEFSVPHFMQSNPLQMRGWIRHNPEPSAILPTPCEAS